MKRLLPLLFLLLTSTVYGQISIERKLAVEGVKDPVFVGQNLIVPAESKLVIKEAIRVAIDTSYKFSDVLVTKDGVNLEQQPGVSEFILTDPGKYRISVVLFDPEKGIKRGESDLVIGTPTPTPPGPTPGPTPDPQPPGPDVKIDNLSVLIIYETSELYPQAIRMVLQSSDLQLFMGKTLPKDSNGQPLWRILDQHISFPVNCDTTFCKWMATQKPTQLPWIILGNKDKIVHQGPLPDNVEAVKALVSKYKK